MHHNQEDADVRAAIYARYSSENQRPESIEDQIVACRRLAETRGFSIDQRHIFSDYATSGARRDRKALTAMMDASEHHAFDIVLVDDLSRLARDNFLMLSVIAELRFHGVRVISVADGLDSEDDDATLGIQIRGVFNELQLRDLRKKTLRGQIGQKRRGYSVGERTFGYRSVPVGEIRIDKHGRPRPDGFKIKIDERESSIVLRIFRDFGDGSSLTGIVKRLNAEGVPGRFGCEARWSPATLTRLFKNEKYIGRWVWNRTETRRDPHSGQRRKFPKPESEWIVQENDALRIVPQELWDRVQTRRKAAARVWPSGPGRRGFTAQRGGRNVVYPTHLFSGSIVCSQCGGTVAQVSGKSRGYYGCLRAYKRACANRALIQRKIVEEALLAEVKRQIASLEACDYLAQKIEQELQVQLRDGQDLLRTKRIEFEAERRRIGSFVNFIADTGNASESVRGALAHAESRRAALRREIEGLEQRKPEEIALPSREWISQQIDNLDQVLERNVQQSGVALRELFGGIVLESTRSPTGKSHHRARTRFGAIDVA